MFCGAAPGESMSMASTESPRTTLACFGLSSLAFFLTAYNFHCNMAEHGPHRLVARTSRCGRDNPGSTPGVVIWRASGVPVN